MSVDFLTPISADVFRCVENLPPASLGQKIALHSKKNGVPPLDTCKIALLGVRENRRETDRLKRGFDFDKIRMGLYSLFPGNWHTPLVDLGDIMPGETVDDTYYAVRETLEQLLDKKIIPIILGGSQDLTYAQYRAYDQFNRMVNLVNIDAKFDFGTTDAPLNDQTYLSKMVLDKPYNLFNYANLGYQTYLNPPDEIHLMEKLYFEAYRLGELTHDFRLAEPVMRDADLVSLDYGSITSSISNYLTPQPNGFDGREICALARYAGISDKVSSFGLYNLHNSEPLTAQSLLVSEIIWYFIEGINFRTNEINISEGNKYLKYSVPIDNEILTFRKSKQTERWWIEIPTFINNKLKKHTFLPCSYQDYLEACNQEIPERWYKARRKNEL